MSAQRQEDVTVFVMPFGKYKGETLEEIFVTDKGYLEWCLDNLENDDIRNKIEEACIILHRKLRT